MGCFVQTKNYKRKIHKIFNKIDVEEKKTDSFIGTFCFFFNFRKFTCWLLLTMNNGNSHSKPEYGVQTKCGEHHVSQSRIIFSFEKCWNFECHESLIV